MRKRTRRWRGLAALAAALVAVAVFVLVVPLWLTDDPVQEQSGGGGGAPTWTAGQSSSHGTYQQKDGVEEGAPATPLIVQRESDGIAAEHEAAAVLVQLPEGAAPDELNAALGQFACVKEAAVTEDDVALGWARVALVEGVSVKDAMSELEDSGVVSAAQPNFVYRRDTDSGLYAGSAADDTFAAQDGGRETVQDALQDSAQSSDQLSTQDYVAYGNDKFSHLQWALPYTHSDQAYDYLVNTLNIDEDAADRPAIAVVDTGCHLGHNDLKDNIRYWYDALADVEGGSDFWDVDTEAHGTHVCGIASARINNGQGIQGSSGNAKLVPIQVFEPDEQYGLSASSITLLRAYHWIERNAATYHIKVINMSLGSNIDAEGLDVGDEAMYTAIGRMARENNVLTVASAGNGASSGPYTDFPTYVNETGIGVIALNSTSGSTGVGRAYFSNYNKPGVKVEQIAAPGVGILSANDGWAKYGTIHDDVYVRYTGTSMASPCVAGIAALVWSINPDLTSDQVKSVLFSTATDIVSKDSDDLSQNRYGVGFDEMSGFGCVNALAAAKAANRYLVGGTSLGVGLSLTLEPSATAQAEAQAQGWTWSWSSSDTGTATVSGGTVSARKAGAVVVTATAGTGKGAIKISQVVTVHDPLISGEDYVTRGDESQYLVKQKAANGSQPYSNGEWLWTSSNEDVLTVDEGGSVTAKSLGTATLTATLASSPAVSTTKEVRVVLGKLSSASVSQSSFVYNGRSQRPTVTVRCASGIVPAGNYTLSWPSNTTSVGTKTITATGTGDYAGTVRVSYSITPNTKDMYRLYNPWTGEHFYTGSASERDSLTRAGWRYEGVGWKAPVSGSDVYRLYNRYSGDHHFTTSAAEKDACVKAGWTYEGVGWKSGGSAKVYREYNPYAKAFYHNYTASASEHRGLIAAGWRDEGVGWYGS